MLREDFKPCLSDTYCHGLCRQCYVQLSEQNMIKLIYENALNKRLTNTIHSRFNSNIRVTFSIQPYVHVQHTRND